MSKSKYYDYEFVGYDYDSVGKFPEDGATLEKYLKLLPIDELSVSLGEGDTPLVQALNLGKTLDFKNLYIKREDLNPTGSFKDRESVIVISHAFESGAEVVHVASSGNAALSTAAYAQKARIKCVCYVPKKTSKNKKKLIELYGAEIVEVEGVYEDVYRLLADKEIEGVNVTSGINGVRTEGSKTIAYEIWEQMVTPDVVVVPCGNGSNLAGIWRGFWELKKLGKTKNVPKMVAVQVKGAAPLKQALESGESYVVLGDVGGSVAEGIVAQESYCSPKAVRAIRGSKGFVVEVSDDEIVEALQQVIGLESLIPEPTAAAAFAAVAKLEGFGIKRDDRIVVVNTGSGMKSLGEIKKLI